MFLNTVKNLIYPPKCVGCGEILSANTDKPFCLECYIRWLEECNSKCPDCGEKQTECRCSFDKEVMETYCHLTEYTSGKNSMAEKVLFSMKSRHNGLLFEFLSRQLADTIKEKYTLDRTVVTFVPRSPEKKRKVGYDQAKQLAKCTAKQLGLPFAELLGHKIARSEQKTLNSEKREMSAEKNYYFKCRNKDFLKYKNVILIDDIGTTGASLNICAGILKFNYARTVHAVTVCKNRPKKTV